MESTLSSLSALLLLGILLGCHYLGFKQSARTSKGRVLQRTAKVRMLGVAIVAPLSMYLALQGLYPLLRILLSQIMLYWLGSTVIEIIWLRTNTLRTKRDWRPLARLLYLSLLILQSGWVDPDYRDVSYAIGSSLILALALLLVHRRLFRIDTQSQSYLNQIRQRLRKHGYLILLCICGFYLLRAWTIIPITSRHLYWFSEGFLLILGLTTVELMATTLEYLLRMRQRSEEVAHLAADAFRATVYVAMAIFTASKITQRDLSFFALSSTFFSVGLGFALKPTLGNLMAGLIMRISRAFDLGDCISVQDFYGEVTRIDWRSISLTTSGQDLITLPHNLISKSIIINHSRPQPLHRSYLQIKLARSIPPGIVRNQLLTIIANIPEVCSTPAPEIYLMELDGWANTYWISCWTSHINELSSNEAAILTQLSYGLERIALRPVHPVKTLLTPG